MEYSIKRILEFKIDDEEIDVFLGVLETIHDKSRRIGFNKHFDKDQQTFVDALYNSLIGQHEENTDNSN